MPNLLAQITQIITETRAKAGRSVNFIVVQAYWQIGQRIIEEEQAGEFRAEYGSNLLGYLSEHLTAQLGKGFDATNLSNMRKFYRTFPNFDAVRQELSWTHYRSLLRVENEQFYLTEAIANNWGTRAIDRQINSLYEDKYKSPDDNPTIGLILCTYKDQTIAKYSVLNGSQQLFASRYQLYLPTEEELRAELERERHFLEQQNQL